MRSSRKSTKTISFFFTVDRDQTGSRRSKPSSRTTLIDEQSNPLCHLQYKDVMSRHRGANRFRRFELEKTISLLSLEYLLIYKCYLYQKIITDHYNQLSLLFELFFLQLNMFLLLYKT